MKYKPENYSLQGTLRLSAWGGGCVRNNKGGLKKENFMDNETCEICGKEIPEGTGDEFLDKSCGYKFWLCDECIDEGDYY